MDTIAHYRAPAGPALPVLPRGPWIHGFGGPRWTAPDQHRLADTLRLWWERACQRRRLADLDGALLKDIGVTRCQAMRECAKWPWQP